MRSNRLGGRARRCAVLWLFFTALCVGCKSDSPLVREMRWPTPTKGAVVSEHPLATAAGLAVLDAGGNAADAAVATALVLAVVYPQAGNLGGGGFALWVPHTGEARAFDFRECAPAAADPKLYLRADGTRVVERSLHGPLAVGVPGTPAGLVALLRGSGSGKFTLAELCQPAITLAQRGFAIDAWLAHDLGASGVAEHMNAAAKDLFFPGGRALREGETLRQPDLANTLALFASQGVEGFYKGPVARALIEQLSAEPIPEADRRDEAWITPADLAGYQVKQRAPLHGWFRGMEIVTMPPPSSGGIVLLQTLGVLEGLPLDAERKRAEFAQRLEFEKSGLQPLDHPGLSERMVHWWIEALRGAFADRAEHLGDPDFVKVPVHELLAPEWIATRRVQIGEYADTSIPAWSAPHEGLNTTHLSVLDVQGNAVSLTTTLNEAFGSGILVRGGGFLLNDEIDDFAVQAGSPNAYGLVGGAANALAPGKRPLSSMMPTVVRDGGHATIIVLGSPGGPKIISAVTLVLLRMLVLGQPLEDAVRAPRLHQQWSPSETAVEPEFDKTIRDELENRRRHVFKVLDEAFASVQAIALREPGAEPVAVSDPRRGGSGGVQGIGQSRPTRPPNAAPKRH